MTQTKTFLDVEGPIRTWARSRIALTNRVGANGIFFGVPIGRVMPVITMARSGGSPVPGEAAVDAPLITFNVWSNSKAEAAEIAGLVMSECESIKAGTKVGSVSLEGATCVNIIWAPDRSKDPDLPRYVVDIQFTVKSLP